MNPRSPEIWSRDFATRTSGSLVQQWRRPAALAVLVLAGIAAAALLGRAG